MKRIEQIILVCLALLAMQFRLYAQESPNEKVVIPLSKPGEAGKLNIGLVTGNISVASYDGKEVSIEVSQNSEGEHDDDDDNDGDRSHRRDPGLKKISNNSFDLEVSEKANVVTVSNGSVNKSVTISVKVPANFSLDLSTVNDGDIKVDNVTGNLELSNVNGSITANGISGTAIANTVNGDIQISFKSITPDTPMAFTTLNGNVEITFPQNLKANIKMKSDQGELFTDFPMDIQKKSATQQQKTASGGTKIVLDQWVTGAVNGGGPEMLFKNMHGDIIIRKGK